MTHSCVPTETEAMDMDMRYRVTSHLAAVIASGNQVTSCAAEETKASMYEEPQNISNVYWIQCVAIRSDGACRRSLSAAGHESGVDSQANGLRLATQV